MEQPGRDRIWEAAEALDLELTDKTVSDLGTLASLVETLGVEAGVISHGDGPKALERHVLDSLRAVPLLASDRIAYDMGSGGGLPGLVVAIVQPEIEVMMVDRRRRKIGFVEVAVDRLGLSNGRAILSDIERLDEEVPLCFARALAPPERSWELAFPRLTPGGRLIYFAGNGFGGVGELPGLVSCETVPNRILETGGPLAIMTRT